MLCTGRLHFFCPLLPGLVQVRNFSYWSWLSRIVHIFDCLETARSNEKSPKQCFVRADFFSFVHFYQVWSKSEKFPAGLDYPIPSREQGTLGTLFMHIVPTAYLSRNKYENNSNVYSNLAKNLKQEMSKTSAAPIPPFLHLTLSW